MTRVILEVCFGPQAGRKIILEPGSRVSIGRTDRADIEIPGDAQMSGSHFELAWDGSKCLLKDLGSVAGTLVGGLRVDEAEVPHGGWIRAGLTDFLVHVEDHTPPPQDDEDAPMETQEELEAKEHALVSLLERAAAQKLYAVVDPAREERILVLLRESVDRNQSLYDGVEGLAMSEVAPYLVEIAPNSTLLARLIMEGWTKRWGIYVVSDDSFTEVRRHFRRILMVEDENGQALYFRFYDPRVLAAFLPTCTEQQRGAIFGYIESFLIEGPRGELVELPREAPRAAETPNPPRASMGPALS
jgi:pSer/pThr/pTyr-binding forkhead associated (FHA) protein